MTAFYRTSSANPIDYIQDINLPLMERALLTNDNYITQAQEQNRQLGDLSVNFNRLAADNEAANKIAQGYTERVNELTTAIQNDPTNWRKQIGNIKDLNRELVNDYRTGAISKIQSNFNEYKKYSDEIDKQTQAYLKSNGKVGIDPTAANAYKRIGLNNFAGTNYESPSSYKVFTPLPIRQNMNVQEVIEKGLKDMEADGQIRVSQEGKMEWLNTTTNSYEGISKERVMQAIMGNISPELMTYLADRQGLGVIQGAFDKTGKFIEPFTITKDSKGNQQMKWNPQSYLYSPIQGALAKYSWDKNKTEVESKVNPIWEMNQERAWAVQDREDAQQAAVDLEANKSENEIKKEREKAIAAIRKSATLTPQQKEEQIAKLGGVSAEAIQLNQFIQSPEAMFTPSETNNLANEYTSISKQWEDIRLGRVNADANTRVRVADRLLQLAPLFEAAYQKSAAKAGITKADFDKIVRFQAGDQFGSTYEQRTPRAVGNAGVGSMNPTSVRTFIPSAEYTQVKKLADKYIDFTKKTNKDVNNIADALAKNIQATQIFYHATPGTTTGDGIKNVVNNLFNSNIKRDFYKADETLYNNKGELQCNLPDKGFMSNIQGSFSDNIDINSLDFRVDGNRIIVKARTKEDNKPFQMVFDGSSNNLNEVLTKAGLDKTPDGRDFLAKLDPLRSSINSKVQASLPLLSSKNQHQSIAGVKVTNKGDYYTFTIDGQVYGDIDGKKITNAKELEAAILYIKGYNID
jgi:hypothetical protein